MRTPAPPFLLLIDHDNAPELGVRRLLREWLPAVSQVLPAGNFDVRVRAYGGWYAGTTPTDARYRAAEFYQQECPALLQLAGRIVRVGFQFADALLIEPSSAPLRISHTVASRPAADWVSRRQGGAKCEEADCQVADVRRWISRRRACLRPACPYRFSDCFERLQQKQVDIHLATDLILSALSPQRDGTHVAVASDDWDLLPAFLAASAPPSRLLSLSSLRFREDVTYLDSELERLGVNIVRFLRQEEAG